jgi:predicted DNA-binding protein
MAKKSMGLGAEPKSTRTSVSFPRELYQTLEQLAVGKKVTVAWIIRDAAEKYVNDQWPLFKRDNT